MRTVLHTMWFSKCGAGGQPKYALIAKQNYYPILTIFCSVAPDEDDVDSVRYGMVVPCDAGGQPKLVLIATHTR